jgi:uncharacterized protein YehS (DUF1456 family)
MYIIQLKYTIEGVSKILVPRDQTYFPKRVDQNLANSLNGLLYRNRNNDNAKLNVCLHHDVVQLCSGCDITAVNF